jgi:Ca-activated chloride channel family protein
MVETPDYYALLGISRKAAQKEIKRAYKKLARRLHPDVNRDADATERFVQLQKAYEVLSDPKQRSEYDASLPPEKKSISFSYQVSRTALPRLNEPQIVYLLFEIAPPPDIEDTPAPPLNISLVVDRSTSMKGTRMDVVKSAAIELIDQLRIQDKLSVIAFSDDAEVVLPARLGMDHNLARSSVKMIQASGGTEIYRGLEAGVGQLKRNLSQDHINHLVLLTDGQTYGDEDACLNLAEHAAVSGIHISCLGIGSDWNDNFLDDLAMRTGGFSQYISRPEDTRKFLRQVYSDLNRIYGESAVFDFNPGPGIKLHYAFRLSPAAGPVQTTTPMRLGSLPRDSSLSYILELVIPPSQSERRLSLVDGKIRLFVPSGNPSLVLKPVYIDIPIGDSPESQTVPPKIMKAMSRLVLYRLQERARREIAQGKIIEATKHLNNLATHLLTSGEYELARTVLQEADQIQQGQSFSEEGKKRIKYGTRALLPEKIPSKPLNSGNSGV